MPGIGEVERLIRAEGEVVRCAQRLASDGCDDGLDAPVLWFGEAWPPILDGDLETISAPMDFVGISYYCHSVVAHGAGDENGDGTRAADIGAAGPLGEGLARLLDVRVLPPTRPVTGLDWEIVPDGLSRTLAWVRDRYGNPPIYIAEMGASFADTVTEDGRVHDPARIAYIRDHLLAAHDAIAEGVDLRGCFIWALLDTYEFNLGYGTRLGLIRVDYGTQRRIVKDSGYSYRDVMAANGFELP